VLNIFLTVYIVMKDYTFFYIYFIHIFAMASPKLMRKHANNLSPMFCKEAALPMFRYRFRKYAKNRLLIRLRDDSAALTTPG